MNGYQIERLMFMNHENRRLFEEILKAKSKYGDEEFVAELSKLMHNFEIMENVKHSYRQRLTH